MRLFRTERGAVVEQDGRFHSITAQDSVEIWDVLVTRDDLHQHLQRCITQGVATEPPSARTLKAPVGSQEIWAAGVTYLRSREARVGESRSKVVSSCYDQVYDAVRPELFFKATPDRVAGPNQPVFLRKDARSTVPEPELALLVSPRGKILACTAANDVTARDLEAENPLYLPQAKIYRGCCALGPALLVLESSVELATTINLEVVRAGVMEFVGETTLKSLKRTFESLVEFLFRDNDFRRGCFLLTGTGVVPPESFTLQPGDEIRITITGIGTLVNTAARQTDEAPAGVRVATR